MALQTRTLVCNSAEFRHYYLCNYRPKSFGPDELSKSIIQFKNGNSVHVDAWTECAIEALEKTPLKKNTSIIRALGHREEGAGPTIPLDTIGKKLAKKFQCRYTPTLLTKGLTPKLSPLKREERAKVLFNQYTFTGNDIKEILIIDDIMTTGATMCTISSSIRRNSPNCSIAVFTLAATSIDSSLNTSLKRDGFLDARLARQPTSMVQEEAQPYSEGAILRQRILNDSFQ